MTKNNVILKEKPIPIPSEKEKKEFLDLELEILNQVGKAVKGHRSMEAYFLAWSTIEQFMLPRIIRFTANQLKIVIPKDALDANCVHLIKYYYFLSHDHELFLALEKGRKNRNKLTHELYEKNTWSEIKKEYKKCLKSDIVKIFSLFRDRFNGKTSIPVLALYAKGWNDGLQKVIDKLDTSF
jgi:hypothetical protein